MARSWVEVDLGAVRANVAALRRRAADAELCAVVKADGYGHGAVSVARAALEAGASWLAVAQAEEVAALRAEGIDADVLVLSDPRPGEIRTLLETCAVLTVSCTEVADAVAAEAARLRTRPRVHIKVDTGMHRLGVAPGAALELARHVDRSPYLDLEGVWTHCAVADEPDRPETAQQLARFAAVLDELAAAGLTPRLRHAANSAGTIAHPAARYDLVRCGIAVYGIAPSPELAGAIELRPALRWTSEIAALRTVAAGGGVSYGLRHRVGTDTVVATVPVGYADGVIRALGLAGQPVLVGGRRCPMVGVVTMDHLMVDLGPDAGDAVGDEVVLLGRQGQESIRPEEWAERAGTIGYEVVCGIGRRPQRRWVER
jgi:alanine racemase